MRNKKRYFETAALVVRGKTGAMEKSAPAKNRFAWEMEHFTFDPRDKNLDNQRVSRAKNDFALAGVHFTLEITRFSSKIPGISVKMTKNPLIWKKIKGEIKFRLGEIQFRPGDGRFRPSK